MRGKPRTFDSSPSAAPRLLRPHHLAGHGQRPPTSLCTIHRLPDHCRFRRHALRGGPGSRPRRPAATPGSPRPAQPVGSGFRGHVPRMPGLRRDPDVSARMAVPPAFNVKKIRSSTKRRRAARCLRGRVIRHPGRGRCRPWRPASIPAVLVWFTRPLPVSGRQPVQPGGLLHDPRSGVVGRSVADCHCPRQARRVQCRFRCIPPPERAPRRRLRCPAAAGDRRPVTAADCRRPGGISVRGDRVRRTCLRDFPAHRRPHPDQPLG